MTVTSKQRGEIIGHVVYEVRALAEEYADNRRHEGHSVCIYERVVIGVEHEAIKVWIVIVRTKS